MAVAVQHLIFCILIGVSGIYGKPPSRIVGGSIADDNEFPYQVSLTVYNQHICGGSIIDATHILTAAHCVEESGINLVNQMVIKTSTNDIGWNGGGKSYYVKSIKTHPQYSPTLNWRNDVAIIELRSKITFDDRQKPVKLPTSDTTARATAVASGWGDLSYPNGIAPSKLRKLGMNILAKGTCVLPSVTVYQGQLCAIDKYGTGLCSGDSGGPLVVDGTVVGIASFVYPCGVGYPDVFTRVYTYVDWIKQVIATS